MDEKFMKVLREQQEIQQKAARILHDTEKNERRSTEQIRIVKKKSGE